MRRSIKRAIDLLFAGALLFVCLPVHLLIAASILVTSGWPVIYRQPRVGRGGRPFTLLKFRTMVNGAHEHHEELHLRSDREHPLLKLSYDPRVTRLGRFLRRTGLDELPQLVNVLGGSMSLVGPRPALYEERAQFSPALLARELVRPGITGLWQVRGRSDPSFEAYERLDLEYLGRWTLRLDLSLLLQTLVAVVRNAFRDPFPPTPDLTAVEHENQELEVLPVLEHAEAMHR